MTRIKRPIFVMMFAAVMIFGAALRLSTMIKSNEPADRDQRIDALFRCEVSDVRNGHYLWPETTVSGRSPRRISARLLNSPSG